MFTRDLTKRIEIGSVPVGGGAPVSVQSMTKTDTRNLEATVSQLKSLAIAGCDIVRVAVPDREAVEALPEILEKSPIPIVADIHFNADLAIASIDKGVHGVRINPGNIDEHAKIRAIAEKAGEKGIPIRVGANSGSLNEHALKKAAGKIDSDIGIETHALVESVLAQCAMLEKYGFEQIKVSLKSSSVPVTTAACRLFAERSPYPQHLGVTEAGSPVKGVVKSAVGIGSLLLDGIGDTIRVSLTSDPIAEVNAGIAILEAAGLRAARPDIVACPTCGRTGIGIFELLAEVEREVEALKAAGKVFPPVKIAVMGCVVNGPGEAKSAELGIAGGAGRIAVFKKGRLLGTWPESEGKERFLDELRGL